MIHTWNINESYVVTVTTTNRFQLQLDAYYLNLDQYNTSSGNHMFAADGDIQNQTDLKFVFRIGAYRKEKLLTIWSKTNHRHKILLDKWSRSVSRGRSVSHESWGRAYIQGAGAAGPGGPRLEGTGEGPESGDWRRAASKSLEKLKKVKKN